VPGIITVKPLLTILQFYAKDSFTRVAKLILPYVIFFVFRQRHFLQSWRFGLPPSFNRRTRRDMTIAKELILFFLLASINFSHVSKEKIFALELVYYCGFL
jgi:hypothetical protein